ncbi:glycosyltransferase [Rhodococcus kroppenstedtii]|uniref:glycosyltransferase n=1 Tax=Rhodococcoides kroppenstedtii TaxID=293050 RepID=UPI0029544763|nr:glycosyltransferase [Rhodococcus kroppenstedtii]MDV7198317.1 glycosyltransferase [Rhodococcus kroppenstedtii]
MSRKSILGDKPVVVSMTSYGVRANLVFAAIESIGFGVDRPRRLILWLDEEELLVNTPVELVRLQRRGLEVRRCANLGPHKKYFPYVTSCFAEPGALVTADDDCFYTRRWLKGLYDAHSETPDSVIGYRVRKVVVDSDGQLRPYTEWGEVNTAEESFSHFSTGVSGVLYPKTVQQALADRGSQFLEVAPRADDLWLHATAVSVGVRTRQVRDRSIDYLELPAAGRTSLYQENVHGGANDRQARLVYTADLLKRIQGDSSLERQ